MAKESVKESKVNPEAGLLLMIILTMAALMVFLPSVVVRAEEPIQLASLTQKDLAKVSAPAPESDGSMPDGIDAVTCAVFGSIPAVVEGPTVLEFWWRGSNTGKMLFTLNGKIQAEQSKDNGWQKYRMEIKEKGTQFIKWVYKPV